MFVVDRVLFDRASGLLELRRRDRRAHELAARVDDRGAEARVDFRGIEPLFTGSAGIAVAVAVEVDEVAQRRHRPVLAGNQFEREPQLVLVHALYAENTFGTVLSAFEEEIAVGRTDLARGGEEFVIRIAVHHGAGRVGGVTPLLVVVAGVEQRAGLEEQDAGFEGQCRA